MGFRINTNVAALDAHRNANMNNVGLDKSLKSLSSGLRINTAADDASGLAIANQLRSQSTGLGQAVRNANDGIGVTQTADGALEEYEGIINTIRTKAIQAGSDGQTSVTRAAIQKDIDRLLEEAQNIASTTSFNGQTLLNGAFEDKAFHIGAFSGETVNISIDDSQTAAVGEFSMVSGTTGIVSGGTTAVVLTATATPTGAAANTAATFTVTPTDDMTSLDVAKALVDGFNANSQSNESGIRASVIESTTAGLYTVRLDSAHDMNVGTSTGVGVATGAAAKNLTNALSTVDVTTRDGAEKAIITADYALRDLDTTRSNIGSIQNQLESTIRNISVTQVNVAAAESGIRDVDFAAESATFAKHNILAQSGAYAMSQANAVQQNVLRLLQ